MQRRYNCVYSAVGVVELSLLTKAMPAKASADIFDLIKSLDPGEKRYFKLQAQLQKGAKNYIRLFDAIDKQVDYDEQALKLHFKAEPFAKQFSVAKNYLYKQILDALDAYNSDSAFEVRRLTHKAEILVKKGLMEQASKVLIKARQAAENGEHFAELFPIYSLELRLEFEFSRDFSKLDQFCQNLHEQVNATVKQLQNLCDYSFGISKQSYILKDLYRTLSRNEIAAKAEAMLQDPLINHSDSPLSLRARSYYHETRSRLFLTTGRREAALQEDLKSIEIDEANPILSGLENYIISIKNLAVSAMVVERFDIMPGLIDRLNKLTADKNLPRQGHIKIKIDIVLDFIQMYNVLGTFEADPTVLQSFDFERVHQNIERYRDAVAVRESSQLLMLLTVLYLNARRFEAALTTAMQFLNDTPPTILRDFHMVMRLSALVCLYEDGDVDAVEHGLKALKRFTKHPAMSTEYEQKMFKYLHRMLRVRSTPEEAPAFADFNEMMTELYAKQSGTAKVLLKVFRDWVAQKNAQFTTNTN